MQTKPKTIDGIKQLAKRIKREGHAETHTAALDIAATHAGFENYRHALSALGDTHARKDK